MWRPAILGVFLLLFQAQDHPTIEVGEDRLLGQGGPAHPLAESHLSADAGNLNHLLVGVIQFTSPRGIRQRASRGPHLTVVASGSATHFQC